MVGVSASVNLPLHHKVEKFSSDTGSSGWSQEKGRKTVVVWCVVVITALNFASWLGFHLKFVCLALDPSDCNVIDIMMECAYLLTSLMLI